MKLIYSTFIIALALALPASAALINHTDAFASATKTDDDDSAATAAAHFLSYAETVPSVAGGSTEIRTQNGPFNNGGTLFLAALANEAQSATYRASNPAIGADAADTHWDTSESLTLAADFASNWGGGWSGFLLEGATSGLLIFWTPGGTTFSVGCGGLTTTPPSDIVSGTTFAGGASAPAGTGLAPVTLSVVENDAHYDFTLTVGGAENLFSVARSALGNVTGIGFYNSAGSGGGNTNIDNVSLTGSTAPSSLPQIASFAANDHYVSLGTPVILSWETTQATGLSIDSGVGDVTALTTNGNGFIEIIAAATTTYTLFATNTDGHATASVKVAVGAPRPNLVFFMVDDMGWQDTSVPLHTSPTLLNQQFRTPNMETLAANGRKFTQAYACAVCSPTRVSLMSGLNAASHKVTNWTLNQNDDQSGTTASLGPPPDWNINGLGPMAETASRVVKTDDTLPRLLQQAGYRTIHAGKAHFGANGLLGADPLNIGFDVNIAGHAAGGPASYYGTQNFGSGPFHVPGLEQYHGQDIFLSEALTLEINKSIETAVQDGAPFFAYMAHYAVHVPIQEDFRFSTNYPGLNPTERAYATMVEGMDKSLGDMLAKLDQLGVAEDTLIIFYSDNGGISYAARGASPYGGINTHNWPLRAGKGSCYEGGIRVPFIASWAKTNAANPFQQAYPIAANSACDAPVIIEDMMPTVLAAAGITPPAGIDGYDISGYINGTPGFQRPESTFLFHYPHIWTGGALGQNQGYEPHCALRDGDWKVIYLYYAQRWELYHLPTDINESNNRAATDLETLMKMSRKMVRLIEERTGQYPVNPATGQPIPLVMSDLPTVDVDNDGIPDNSEDLNRNGLVDPGETDPDNPDTDSDGINDGDEIRLGTDPLDSESVFSLAIQHILVPDESLEISWPSAPGTFFTVYRCDCLTNWVDVVTNGLPASTGSSTRFNLGALEGSTAFYCVELED